MIFLPFAIPARWTTRVSSLPRIVPYRTLYTEKEICFGVSQHNPNHFIDHRARVVTATCRGTNPEKRRRSDNILAPI